jgi:thioredoxin reductase (NADPH)
MFGTTSTGVFAVGDVCSRVKRVASAVGDGAIAARQVYDYLVRLAEDVGIGVRSDG